MAGRKKVSKKSKPRSKKVHNRRPLYLLALIGALVLFGLLGYSTFQYNNSEESSEGFFICNNDKTDCELSQHIHADIHMKVCDQYVRFPKEKGRTDQQHTHKEVNKIHWHARVKADPETRKPLETKQFTIAAFLEQMGYEFPKSCEEGVQPELSVIINGEAQPEELHTIWQDGDEITATYR